MRIANPFALIFGWLLSLLCSQKTRAEDHVDYRYEYYQEENDRIRVDTYSVLVEQHLTETITATGELIYDGISGATPTGSPPLVGSSNNSVPVTTLEEIRRAANLALNCRWGMQTLTPGVAYSKESDYKSTGISLNDAIDFNNKNTTLRLGVAHDFDEVLDNSSPRKYRNKETTDGLIGISQLLGPKTVFTADFTYGTESGYLDDPYRGIRFDGWLPFTFLFPENRPDDRTMEILLLTLTQFVEKLKGSAEVSYRFYHDSFGILSQTAALTWHQNIGRHLVIEPTFRYYEQTDAFFYYLSVPGFVPTDGDPARPKYYSADYRLSHLQTFTYGVQAVFRVVDWLSVDLGYQRYEMSGLDNKTSQSAYPKANIVTTGLRLWF